MSFLVNNTGTNYSLYYNVLDYFKTIMSNHPSIEDVSQGPIDNFDNVQFPSYPLGNIVVIGATFGTSTTTYEVQLLVADKIKNKNNESEGERNLQTIPFYGVDDVVDIHANTFSIVNDLTSYTQRNVEALEVNDDIACTPFMDRFNNGLAGWASTFVVRAHNDRNRCLFELF